MNIINKNIDEIKPYENNPRKNAKAINPVKESIKKFGIKQPLVIDETGVIVVGHTRYKACLELGFKEIPCVLADDLTDEEIRAYRLADNKTNEFSLWDENALELELLELKPFDMSPFGFAEDEKSSSKEKEQEPLENMQLKVFEHYDYLVFVFKNMPDWLNVVNYFDMKKVNAGYGKTKKVGIGRVIDGKRLLEILQYSDDDSKQE